MKQAIWVLSLACVFTFAACQTVPTEENVSLPQTTPFDQSAFERQAYLDGYRDGYRSVTRGGSGSVDLLRSRHRTAEEMGWRAGVADAHRAQEKAK
jgi:hypothetical protein